MSVGIGSPDEICYLCSRSNPFYQNIIASPPFKDILEVV